MLTPARYTPAELAVALFCRGMRLDSSILAILQAQDGRPVMQRRAGLGSGLEIAILGERKPIWVNVPVREAFAAQSPYSLVYQRDRFWISHQDYGPWPVILPLAPGWYGRKTTTGKEMSRIGILQGTCLGIYVGKRCAFWGTTPIKACHFCTTGINVGVHEEGDKTVQEVVETCQAAKQESHTTFVHFNSGYQEGRDIEQLLPFVQAVKTRVGMLVGIQCIPPPDPHEYEPLLRLGADHFSLCYELHSPQAFATYLPGKTQHLGQERFFRALEFLCQHMPRGSVSGEIIAGLEPVASTLQAIEYITGLGAFPTVCIFRPVAGAALQSSPPPQPDEMLTILRQVALSCRKHRIPVGLAPNIETSLVMTPDDCRYLLPKNWHWYLEDYQLRLLKLLARPVFAWKMRTCSRKVPAA